MQVSQRAIAQFRQVFKLNDTVTDEQISATIFRASEKRKNRQAKFDAEQKARKIKQEYECIHKYQRKLYRVMSRSQELTYSK